MENQSKTTNHKADWGNSAGSQICGFIEKNEEGGVSQPVPTVGYPNQTQAWSTRSLLFPQSCAGRRQLSRRFQDFARRKATFELRHSTGKNPCLIVNRYLDVCIHSLYLILCSVGNVKGFPHVTLPPGCTPPALAEPCVLAVLPGCPATFFIQKASSCQDVFIIQVKIAQEVTISKTFSQEHCVWRKQ